MTTEQELDDHVEMIRLEEEVDEFLDHHGVKGQKWGVRRRSGHSSASGDAKTAHGLRKKKLHTLSNADLKAINERMNLEQNFRRMNPSKKDKGKRAAKGILATAGAGVTVFNMVKSPAGQAAISAGKQALGR